MRPQILLSYLYSIILLHLNRLNCSHRSLKNHLRVHAFIDLLFSLFSLPLLRFVGWCSVRDSVKSFYFRFVHCLLQILLILRNHLCYFHRFYRLNYRP